MNQQLLDKSYNPHQVEKQWYEYWEKEKLFAAKPDNEKESYSIVIPPPNVTGVLHMGHALNITLQDIMCRYRRIQGDNVLWMPGTDHAGIATQNVVEKKLAEEDLDRHQVGRDKFIERVWEWRKEYGGAIINQLKRLGASCDWDRERFTMDEGLSKAVRKVFVDLYNQGLIYQGKYITNWCPRCHTALADLEVEYEDQDGNLYHIHYPFADGNGGVVVATTRPETMLGDTAVAVHPDDERYQNVDTHVILPLMNRKIPIIQDDYVDLKFGTGALKVTPAHDPNDFEIGSRHNLDSIKVIGDDGRMTAEAGEFAGLDRFKCREKIVEVLEKQGLLKKIEPLKHSVGQCYRCKTTVEPNLSKQWFIKIKPLAEKAIAAVENGDTKIIPEAWTKTYFEWMYNIKDWCISRQIWWGHRIPAWICQDCGRVIVALDTPETCTACNGTNLNQETDVLDTWFSSALWPFSTMGWPDKTPLLQCFYPTSVLVTGFDILFFWVARMMMMGLHFMKDIPFKDVYVHALVRDENGKKMSKSKGNVIDPLKVIDEYGTDAFRFTLAAFAAQGRDIKLSEKRVGGYRHFINKLWNAARFSLMHLSDDTQKFSEDSEMLSISDYWILSRLSKTEKKVAQALENYKFNEAASELYSFIWHEFCDWYLEVIKPALYDKEDQKKKTATLSVLHKVMHDALILLHPFIPFVTEEIWNKLPGTDDSIMKASFPQQLKTYPDAEKNMELLMQIITSIRNIRGEMNIAPSMTLNVSIQAPDEIVRSIIAQHLDIIINLARLNSFSVQEPGPRPEAAATAVVGKNTVFVSLEGIIDFDQEVKRLEKEIEKLNKELVGINKKLANEDFLSKAPQKVVEKVRGKYAALNEKQKKLQANLEKVIEIKG
ncbi:Valine--tRNA ligase [Candidatus Magnetomoraceae bacterium gMMP-15]